MNYILLYITYEIITMKVKYFINIITYEFNFNALSI